MPKTIEFNNPPEVVRAYVKSWLDRAKSDKTLAPAQVAVVKDILTLVDIALPMLQPAPAEPAES